MPITEHPMQALESYLPNNTFQPVVQYIHHYKVHLTVTKKRKSVLGDYRHSGMPGDNHRISINGNLNKYEFLITLLHELAHLLTYEEYKKKVEPHGKEWKTHYSRLLVDFVQRKIFPDDIEQALQKSILNPAATANGEIDLMLVLRSYNTTQKVGFVPISQLPDAAFFSTEDGRIFKKIGKRTKRYQCLEITTGRHYIFSALSEVKPVVAH
ncbi:MAG: SprT-like domain-containing protein [Deinococcales bacterium]|nr:SprT-like domain-containing protein [Chitinophagaceae bacterium]